MLNNARITQNEEGYWLQVESKTASASLNLSIISKSELTSKALEEWAEEQTQAGLDIQTQIIHEMAYAMLSIPKTKSDMRGLVWINLRVPCSEALVCLAIRAPLVKRAPATSKPSVTLEPQLRVLHYPITLMLRVNNDDATRQLEGER